MLITYNKFHIFIFIIILFFSPTLLFAQGKGKSEYYDDKLLIDEFPENKSIAHIDIVLQSPLSTNIIPIEFIVNIGNSIHVNTNKQIIKEEISLKVGDLYKQSYINEIVNHLNSLKIIAQANCYPIKTNSTETVNIIFEIIDEWSLSVNPSIYYSGGVFTWQIGIKEKNLFGLNKELGFELAHNGNYFTSINYYDSSMFSPLQYQLKSEFIFDENFKFNYLDIFIDIKVPLTSILRKYGFDFNYHYINGVVYNSKNTEEKYFSFYDESAGETIQILLPNYYLKAIHTLFCEYSFLESNGIENKFTFQLSLNFIQYDLVEDIQLDSSYIEEYKEQLFPILPYNYISFIYSLSNIKYVSIPNFQVYNRECLFRKGIINEFSITRADKLLGSPSNSTIFKKQFSYFFDILNYLFLIMGEYYFEIDISDYSTIVSNTFGINQTFYFRPLIIGEFVFYFNVESNLKNTGDRIKFFSVGGNIKNSCWVRGVKSDYLYTLNYINFIFEYRTGGFIHISRKINMGFAFFYDLAIVFDDINYVKNNTTQLDSIGLGLRIDVGYGNMLLVDVAYLLGSNFLKNLQFAISFYSTYKF